MITQILYTENVIQNSIIFQYVIGLLCKIVIKYKTIKYKIIAFIVYMHETNKYIRRAYMCVS